MKKLINLLLVSAISLSFVSCWGIVDAYLELIQYNNPAGHVHQFMPGECLASNVLDLTEDEDRPYTIYFDLDIENLGYRRIDAMCGYSTIENGAVKDLDVEDMAYVHFAYDRYCDNLFRPNGEAFKLCYLTTIICSGGISITSNREFAGIPAGEDLSGLFETGYYREYFSEETMDAYSTPETVYNKSISLEQDFAPRPVNRNVRRV